MNFVMIGCGMVAQTHVLAVRDNTVGARLTGVLGRDAARMTEFCADAAETLGYPVAPFPDLDAAIAAGADAALLITPPDARLNYVKALVAAGMPTLMEKPLERTLEAAHGIANPYTHANVALALCFQHRTRAAARDLKARLETGQMGDIVHVDLHVPWWREQAYYDVQGRGTYARDGGGVMINQAIHTLDLALWLAGPVARLQAMMRTSPLHDMEAEDIAAALLTFASGATGVLNATTTAYPGEAESITVTTTKARAHLQGDALRIDWLDGRHEALDLASNNATGGGADPMAFTHAWHQAVVEDFVSSTAQSRPPLAPPSEALHVHAVIDAMERAAQSGRTVEVTQ